jgi:plasmid stabilization system protein ParE
LKRPVRIGAGAQADMAEASRWYDARQSGLGLDFLRSVGRVIARIEEAPHAGSRVPGVADADVRRIPVRRFPYHVVYIELPDRAQILAVAHHRRRPRYWIGRVPH